MRPERLEVTGFGVFRATTVVDFAGADLFALSGPTGAGKSTVIDAIVFALYGSVPRYDDKRMVAPVISQGAVEARVLLDFSVGGERYRIARVVRATGKGNGATTKEARLERSTPDDDGDDVVEVLAGTADEVTLEVQRLLGLTFEHFTTCVVLPQGDFQRFLHQKPSARQDLLVELLDLGVYGRMGQHARERATRAGQQRELVVSELAGLAGFTVEHRAALERDAASLDKLLAVIDEALPAIAELRTQATARAAAADEADGRAKRLAAVALPKGVAELADRVRAAADAVTAAQTAEHAAAQALAAVEADAADLPDRSALEAVKRDHAARADEAARVAKGDAVVVDAQAEEAAARADADAGRSAHEGAEQALDVARRVNRAHEFASALVVGEPCPVCLTEVGELPTHDLGDLDALVKAEKSAAKTRTAADARLQQATQNRVRCDDLLVELGRRVAELDARLAGAPDPDVITSQLAQLDRHAEQLKVARAAEAAARTCRQQAERAVHDLRADEQAARRRFDDARDAVAALGPPPAERVDLAADWHALVTWAAEQHPAALAAAADARARAREADDEARRRTCELDDACTGAGINAGRRPVRDVVVEYQSNVRADLESIDAGLARRAELEQLVVELTDAEQVASALVTHLRSTGFEKWVLDEVYERLVAGATSILHELSGGSYSLTFDKRSNFSVIDHANADAVRSARTLSGGETFLTSLALALSLADEVASLAASGTARLESIFLDEGFGTLDPDTLDTVATAIEELGAGGRMVGLVTHVQDLAERLPVRFEIERHGNASTIERVEL